MKAVVLAGGYATRLWPITKNRPKMMLPLGDTLVIDRIFSELEADDRISEVYVSTNERFARTLEAHIASSPFEKPRLSVEPTTTEDEKRGVVWALSELVDREAITEDLVVVAGDNLLSFDLGQFIDVFQGYGAPTLAAYDVGSREKATSYGLVTLEDDRVVDFQEKPDDPQSTLVSIACYGLPAPTLDKLDTYLAAGNNPDEPGYFIDWLHTRTPVYGYRFDGAWFDIGTPESYLEAIEWILEGDAHLEPTAETVDCSLGDNVHVMGGAELRNVDIDSAVVFPETEIADCAVSNSIIDRSTQIVGVDLEDAVISAHSQLIQG
ncbi:MAG: NDP-sugar synthase [Halovenus sp.]